MAITTEEVEKISKLAKLNFNEQEKQKLQQELSGILNYVDQLQAISEKSVGSVDPDSVNLMRDDAVEEAGDVQKFLQQAPGREGDYVKVKSILE